MRYPMLTGALFLGLVACGGSFPPPADRLATAEAASRSARELRAESDPQASLHLKLAEEQIAQAKKFMESGDNERADEVLQRAKADAELAVQLAKEASTKAEAKSVLERIGK